MRFDASLETKWYLQTPDIASWARLPEGCKLVINEISIGSPNTFINQAAISRRRHKLWNSLTLWASHTAIWRY